MLNFLRAFFLLFLLIAQAAATAAAEAAVQAKHARIELISQKPDFEPGKEQLLGVRFVMEAGWHIYWINPGDSGQPPVLKWQLPEGFHAGEIQWPRPERMQSSSQLADYGYHDEVLLLVPLRAPSFSNTGSQAAPVILDAKWLICREVCLPDHAQLQLSLSSGSGRKGDPKTEALFARAISQLPKPLPQGWRAGAKSRNEEFLLTIHAGRRLSKAEFYPLDPSQIENAAPQRFEPSAAGGKIALKKSDQLLKPIKVLRGLLILPGGEAYRVDAPLSNEQIRAINNN
jgi:thiol:disulfide interchange protein DsbD